VSFARLLSHIDNQKGEDMRRCIGLDVHREFAQVAVWEGGAVRQLGQIATTPEALRLFADSLEPSDEVAIEATCNTHAIAGCSSRASRASSSRTRRRRARSPRRR
jgi:hypothetical protein